MPAVRLPVEQAAAAATFILLAVAAPGGAGWIRALPWTLIGTVAGVSLLANLVQQAGGMTLLVDISPLSPVGALCQAYTRPGAGRQALVGFTRVF